MASGFFPAPKHDEMGQKLAEARGLIRSVIDDWYDSRGDLNAEDAASDQSYVDGLSRAEDAVASCVTLDESDPAVIEQQVAAWERRQEDAEREADRWRGLRSKLRAKAALDAVASGPVNFKMDGNKWCATRPDFVDLHESPAGFGDTQEEAVRELVAQEQ